LPPDQTDRERALKIAVCMKRVPEMELRFSIAADRKSLDQAGLKYEISDFDGYALELALQLVERAGAGEVVVVSIGPDGAQETLRKALAMGATRAVQLKADEVPFDGFAVASALAAELKDGGYDLILFGRMATDTASGTVGAMTAHLLDLPCVTAISHFELADRRVTARRDLEGAAETVQLSLPAVVTIDEGIARPRLATLKGIMAAKKKPLEVKPAQLGKVSLTVDGMALPPERTGGRIVGEGADAVPELVRLLRTEAKVL
jgi:electron transfer flavoprotein beta subunit